MSLIERGDYPTLTKPIVMAQVVKLARLLQDQLISWCGATKKSPREANFVSEIDPNGVQLFWIEPAKQLEGRPAVAWCISAAGIQCTDGVLGKLPTK